MSNLEDDDNDEKDPTETDEETGDTESRVEAYRKGLDDKDYTWAQGFEDALSFKGGYTDDEQEAFEDGKRDREKMEKENELEEKREELKKEDDD